MKIWISAARVRTLPAAAAPVSIGAAIAWQSESFHAPSAFMALIGAMILQLGTNFANDYYDFIKGVDNSDRVGPMRATQSGEISPKAMKAAFILTFSLLLPIIYILSLRAGWGIAVLGVASILSGILYTGGPKPLGYMGLGDIFVLIFFGPIAVAGTVYVQSLVIDRNAVWAGFAVGMISTAILAVNNLRDMEEDAKVGKKTLAVRLGPTFVRYQYLFCIGGAAGIAGLMAVLSKQPLLWIAAASSLTAIPMIRSMFTEKGAQLDPNLKKTGLFLMVYSLLFSVGWIW